ncbi:hypothetical protein CmeUKMEL1_01620 [Cryptosporidium meleagridis]|uniref:Integral membrane protein n=1 Tax=Cryptosporidium meleagridis TaxID=93969 RepID=A0A2P4YWW4_9CRYT|nr:hypothetical protein CmeUKMEL1_01620 [Cryptosporidium meleagridis]
MKAYFNLAIWAFTIFCLFQKLNKCSDYILYCSSFSERYISPCHKTHSLLFTKAANNLEIQGDEYEGNSDRGRRDSESSISSADFSSSDSEFSGCDGSSSRSDESCFSVQLPKGVPIETRLRSYLALKLPDKFGQSSNPLKRTQSLGFINSKCYDNVFDSDSDDSVSSIFPTDGNIVYRLKSYLALKLPEKFDQPSDSQKGTRSLSSINLGCERYDTALTSDESFDSDSFNSDDSGDDDLARPRACNFHSLSNLCSDPLGATGSDIRTVNSKRGTGSQSHSESALSKPISQPDIRIEKPFHSKRHRTQKSAFFGLRQRVATLNPLFGDKIVSHNSPNPILKRSSMEQNDIGRDPDHCVTNRYSISNIRLATPTKTNNQRVVSKDVSRVTKSRSVSVQSPTFPKNTPERQKSVIPKSALESKLQNSSIQLHSAMPSTRSSSKRRAPLPPAHPPYSVSAEKKGSTKRQAPLPPAIPPYSVSAEKKSSTKRRAPPPPTDSPCIKVETKHHKKRRAPPPPNHPPYSVSAEKISSLKHQAPPSTTHPPCSVRERTRGYSKRRAPSPPLTQPYSLKHSLQPSSQKLTIQQPIQSSSQATKAIRKGLSTVKSCPRRRSSSSPPLIPSSSSASKQPLIRQRSSSLPPRPTQRHKQTPVKSTSESSQQSPSKQKPPRPPLPTIHSIHVHRMLNA